MVFQARAGLKVWSIDPIRTMQLAENCHAKVFLASLKAVFEKIIFFALNLFSSHAHVQAERASNVKRCVKKENAQES